jgi:hypothetical protein
VGVSIDSTRTQTLRILAGSRLQDLSQGLVVIDSFKLLFKIPHADVFLAVFRRAGSARVRQSLHFSSPIHAMIGRSMSHPEGVE